MHVPLSSGIASEKRNDAATTTRIISSTTLPITNLEHINRPEQAHLRSTSTFCIPVDLPTKSELSLSACCASRVAKTQNPPRTAMVSKSTRILILLAIDSAFFLLELVVGQSGCYRTWANARANVRQDMPSIRSLLWPTPFIWFVLPDHLLNRTTV